jgi:predicted methyltransferase
MIETGNIATNRVSRHLREALIDSIFKEPPRARLGTLGEVYSCEVYCDSTPILVKSDRFQRALAREVPHKETANSMMNMKSNTKVA